MKRLTEQQLKENYLKLRQLITDTFSGERLERLNKMYDDLEDRVIVAPASGKEEYHYCHVGGYVEHILHVVDTARKMSDLFEVAGGSVDWSDEELVFAALHHDLGKIGDLEGNDYYVIQDNDWRVKNMGEIYTHNNDLSSYMNVTDRSLFILQHYGIEMSEWEYLGLKLADGLYEDANEKYLKGYNPAWSLKSNIAYIIHQADMMATHTEYDEWHREDKKESAKVEQSVNKIKQAVDTEVKEKFNTKTTDAKDIFNELFGEPKK